MKLNRGLLVVAAILILGGFLSGLYFVSIFGFLVLIPALTSSRQTVRPRPTQTTQSPRRITPPPIKQTVMESSKGPPPEVSMVPSPAPPQQTNYSPALFPGPLLPSLSAMASSEMAKPVAEKKEEGRDELLEVGAILLFLKLAQG